MRVILNSDITYPHEFARTLTARVRGLVEACRTHRHTVVIPRTTALEFGRQQEVHRTKAVAELEGSLRLLDRFGIRHDEVIPGDAVTAVGLSTMVREIGAMVEEVDPTHEDLLSAHDRACLHAPPGKPEAKSDEMRDLVIWAIAITYARQGQTLLVSHDDVHRGDRGADEASAVGLRRASTIEEALDLLEVETPMRLLMLSMFAAVWEDLRTGGAPLAEQPQLRDIREARFVRGMDGIERVSATALIPARSGDHLSVQFTFQLQGNRVTRVGLRSLRSSPEDVYMELEVDRAWTDTVDDLGERVRSLKEVLDT